jgi:hypothetical protein
MATFDVTQAYQSALGRAPDAEGLAYWTNAISSGASLNDVLAAISSSPEAQIYNTYQTVLNKAPDDDGRSFWTNAVAQGADINTVLNDIRSYAPDPAPAPMAAPAPTQIAASSAPQTSALEPFTSSVAVYPHPVGYNTQISYDSKGDRVYTYTPDGSTYTNVPFYEGSRLGTPITNPNHPLLQNNSVSEGMSIDNVTAGMISNILSGALGGMPSLEDVYNVYGRVGSTATDWGDLAQQTISAWNQPQLSQGTQNESQQYFAGIPPSQLPTVPVQAPVPVQQQPGQGEVTWESLVSNGPTPAQIAAANRAAGITTQVNQFDVPDMLGQRLNAQQTQQMQPRQQMGTPGVVSPYSMQGALEGAPQSTYDPFAALQSMQRQPMDQQFSQPFVQNPVFGGSIPMDFGPGPGNAAIDTSAQSQAAREVMANLGQAGNAPTPGQSGPTGTGTISRPVAVQPGETVNRADGTPITIGDTSIRSEYGGNSGILVPVDNKFIDSRTGQDYSDFVSPLDRQYLEAIQSGNTQRAQELDLIRGSVFETLINQDSGYSTPPVNLRPMDVFVPAYATPNGEIEAPYVIMAVPRSDDSGTFMEVVVPLDEYQEQPFDWLAYAGNQA